MRLRDVVPIPYRCSNGPVDDIARSHAHGLQEEPKHPRIAGLDVSFATRGMACRRIPEGGR
jgi:hypothetical protein